ncbi:MAG: prolipoprotein diacylglyceryl transferase [Acidobacteriota bacterium]|nr:MAG: prolipoprotein diacylglyceryl transferase [Acidobacteriota bacterium]
MRPRFLEFFTANGLPEWLIPDYWFMMTLAIIVACVGTLRLWIRGNKGDRGAQDLLLFGIPALFIGARLFHFLQFGFPENLWDLIFAGGLGFYGGLFAVVMVWILTAWLKQIPLMDFLDTAAAPMSLGLALGRIGCLLAGCDGGIVAGLPWALRFPAGTSSFMHQVELGVIDPTARLSLPAHPTQLYEAVFALTAGFLLLRLLRIRSFSGEVFLTGMVWYSLFRFVVEFLRADMGGWHPFGLLTFSQFLSLLLLVVSIVLLRFFSSRARRIKMLAA